MFTGIVQQLGTVSELVDGNDNRRITITLAEAFQRPLKLGDSIAVNGVCLTVVSFRTGQFSADASVETLRLTTLGSLSRGMPVNIEAALTLADSLGGHLVSGHVDGIGTVTELTAHGESLTLVVRLPAELMRYVAVKGSVCMDGVSLTVNALSGDTLSVHLVPHTLAHTTMHTYAAGTAVNIEVDLLARYLERLTGAHE